MRRCGFSLIEVIIAVGIIALMIVATATLLSRIPADGREVRDRDLALKIAENELEALRAAGYGALPASGAFTDSLLGLLPGSAASVTIVDYSAKTKRVDVDVSWQAAGSVARSVSLTTLITLNSGLP